MMEETVILPGKWRERENEWLKREKRNLWPRLLIFLIEISFCIFVRCISSSPLTLGILEDKEGASAMPS